MRYSVFFLLVLTAACATPDEDTRFTQIRGEAVQNAAILNRVVGSVAQHCVETPLRKDMHIAYSAWHKQNKKLLIAAEHYHRDFIATIVEKKGNINARQMEEALLQEVVGRSDMIVTRMFGSKMEKTTQCRSAIQAIESGKFDLERNTDFYPVLQELVVLYTPQPQ